MDRHRANYASFRAYLMTVAMKPITALGRGWRQASVLHGTHARRRFRDAQRAQPPGTTGRADIAIEYFRKLYQIERKIADADPQTRYHKRQSDSVPLLKNFRSWLDEALTHVAPKAVLGEALQYLDKYWPKLIRYCEDGRLPIGRVSDWRGKHTLRGVTVGRQSRCLSPRRMSRFQSPLVEPDVQISRIRLSSVSLRPSRSPRLPGCRGVDRGRASDTDTRPDIDGIRYLACPVVGSTIVADGARYIHGSPGRPG